MVFTVPTRRIRPPGSPIGLLNTLIDAPRFLWLLLVLAWLAGARESAPPGEPATARPPAAGAAP